MCICYCMFADPDMVPQLVTGLQKTWKTILGEHVLYIRMGDSIGDKDNFVSYFAILRPSLTIIGFHYPSLPHKHIYTYIYMGKWWYIEVQYINCRPITQHYIYIYNIYIYIYLPPIWQFGTQSLSIDPIPTFFSHRSRRCLTLNTKGRSYSGSLYLCGGKWCCTFTGWEWFGGLR